MNPTDPRFYASHSDENLSALAVRFEQQGKIIAGSYGADHPLAVELAAMWAAVTGQQILRSAR